MIFGIRMPDNRTRTIVESRAIEVVIYSGSAWEHGVELYAVLLNYQGEACQFVMFMSDPSTLPKTDKAWRWVQGGKY